VYLLEGINDLRAGRLAAVIIANVERMVQAITAAGAVPVLLTVLPTGLSSPTNGRVRALDRLILALGALRHVRACPAVGWRHHIPYQP
jgi:hypothetical protein